MRSLQSEVHETHRNHIPIHFVKEHDGVLIAFIKSKRVFRKLQTNNILKINFNCPSNFFLHRQILYSVDTFIFKSILLI